MKSHLNTVLGNRIKLLFSEKITSSVDTLVRF